ncbi:hypothetical protein SAMN02745781_03473 [Vibrio gazogenes DSM 21264]|uniref:Uncharacterized protein n=1 Tax=Vibrio gazogenes DSM 21264 = NBRC 103151 TaxID=1123492 RepID=A0A1M5FHI0_VIBGA|nr:hypothetical protein SAMN02745781_03473 [Vibrio gazogenes DSM 21264] [Vibrio gazogenes DSM 21264 = NBRC 103151]SJN52838.1 hypothetical protein BQ6471_00101 [Vibrio gazogenes]
MLLGFITVWPIGAPQKTPPLFIILFHGHSLIFHPISLDSLILFGRSEAVSEYLLVPFLSVDILRRCEHLRHNKAIELVGVIHIQSLKKVTEKMTIATASDMSLC